MKYVDEFRNPSAVKALAAEIAQVATKPWTIMEVCGGQTHSIVKDGLDQLLPAGVELIHGPGCPVCVTPTAKIDAAIALAQMPEVILCSFGDMLRVPGNESSLLNAKAAGADVRVVYSPLDALEVAKKNPERQVVFFAVGFETTAPANAMAVFKAEREGVRNFSIVVSHVLVPPALTAILAAGDNRVQGFLAAGHVCTIMGTHEYEPIARQHRVPIVVTGFEPLDIMQGVLWCLRQLEQGRYEVENQYARSVRPEGNRVAQSLLGTVFEVCGSDWRGIGEIAASGLKLRGRYQHFDAEARLLTSSLPTPPVSLCQAGRVLTGNIKPPQCPAFGQACTPERPLGAPMVSTEGACAAYYNYRQRSQYAGL